MVSHRRPVGLPRRPDRLRIWPSPPWRWPGGSRPAPPCGAWSPSGRPTAATWPSSSSTRSSSASGPCPPCTSTATGLATPCACLPGPATCSWPSAGRRSGDRGPAAASRSVGPHPDLVRSRAPAPPGAGRPRRLGGRSRSRARRPLRRMVLLYHLLWELTHVVFEHPGLLDAETDVHRRGVHHLFGRGPGRRSPGRSAGDGVAEVLVHGRRDGRRQPGRPVRPATCCSSTPAWPSPRPRWPAGMSAEPTGFLYPFIEAEERDAGVLLGTWPRRPRAKMAESRALRAATLERCRDPGRSRPPRWRAGSGPAAVFAFGNGGSATDAEGTVALFRDPPAAGPCRPCPWWTIGPC